MDIELELDNGIQVAGMLNEKWPDCAIIYVTNYLFYAIDIYQTEHIYFVLKEQFEKGLLIYFINFYIHINKFKIALFLKSLGSMERKYHFLQRDYVSRTKEAKNTDTYHKRDI